MLHHTQFAPLVHWTWISTLLRGKKFMRPKINETCEEKSRQVEVGVCGKRHMCVLGVLIAKGGGMQCISRRYMSIHNCNMLPTSENLSTWCSIATSHFNNPRQWWSLSCCDGKRPLLWSWRWCSCKATARLSSRAIWTLWSASQAMGLSAWPCGIWVCVAHRMISATTSCWISVLRMDLRVLVNLGYMVPIIRWFGDRCLYRWPLFLPVDIKIDILLFMYIWIDTVLDTFAIAICCLLLRAVLNELWNTKPGALCLFAICCNSFTVMLLGFPIGWSQNLSWYMRQSAHHNISGPATHLVVMFSTTTWGTKATALWPVGICCVPGSAYASSYAMHVGADGWLNSQGTRPWPTTPGSSKSLGLVVSLGCRTEPYWTWKEVNRSHTSLAQVFTGCFWMGHFNGNTAKRHKLWSNDKSLLEAIVAEGAFYLCFWDVGIWVNGQFMKI